MCTEAAKPLFSMSGRRSMAPSQEKWFLESYFFYGGTLASPTLISSLTRRKKSPLLNMKARRVCRIFSRIRSAGAHPSIRCNEDARSTPGMVSASKTGCPPCWGAGGPSQGLSQFWSRAHGREDRLQCFWCSLMDTDGVAEDDFVKTPGLAVLSARLQLSREFHPQNVDFCRRRLLRAPYPHTRHLESLHPHESRTAISPRAGVVRAESNYISFGWHR